MFVPASSSDKERVGIKKPLPGCSISAHLLYSFIVGEVPEGISHGVSVRTVEEEEKGEEGGGKRKRIYLLDHVTRRARRLDALEVLGKVEADISVPPPTTVLPALPLPKRNRPDRSPSEESELEDITHPGPTVTQKLEEKKAPLPTTPPVQAQAQAPGAVLARSPPPLYPPRGTFEVLVSRVGKKLIPLKLPSYGMSAVRRMQNAQSRGDPAQKYYLFCNYCSVFLNLSNTSINRHQHSRTHEARYRRVFTYAIEEMGLFPTEIETEDMKSQIEPAVEKAIAQSEECIAQRGGRQKTTMLSILSQMPPEEGRSMSSAVTSDRIWTTCNPHILPKSLIPLEVRLAVLEGRDHRCSFSDASFIRQGFDVVEVYCDLCKNTLPNLELAKEHLKSH